MIQPIEGATIKGLKLMLRALVKFCLRHSLTLQDLVESAKVVFIETASEEIQKHGHQVNVSRLSIMTGMHRRDVMRIYRNDVVVEGNTKLSSRVIGQWEQDARFHDASGKPRVLDENEFKRLVSLISQDLKAGTVLFELERVGAIERVKGGVKLKHAALVVQGNPGEAFELLGRDVEDLIYAVEDNILTDPKVPNLHARTEYDNISKKHLDLIKRWLLKEGSKFHREARNFISQYDKDINTSLTGEGKGRVVLGAFGWVSKN